MNRDRGVWVVGTDQSSAVSSSEDEVWNIRQYDVGWTEIKWYSQGTTTRYRRENNMYTKLSDT